MTTYCTNSMQAVASSGFAIDTSTGYGTDGIQIGNPADNTVLFPKQLLINNAKANIIEMEIPAGFDIDYATGTAYATAYNVYSNQFKNGNFPMNFVISGHYQGIGTNCRVPGWGVTSTGLTTGLSSILTTQKAANPNYANMNTLANYLNGVKSSTIVGSVSGATTTITVTNSKPITDFTLKTTVGNVLSATCDGTAAKITQDSITGSTYVTATLAAGTHTFVITGTNSPVQPPTSPVASFTTSVASGTTPLAVIFTSTSSGATSFSWDFGDGTTETGESASHTFTNAGTSAVTYTVTLTATASNGATSTATTTITVNPSSAKPVPAFTVSPSSGITTSTTCTFTDTSTNNPTTSAWVFGDGGSASGKKVTHKFTKAGSMSVKLTTSNTAGSATLTKTVSVAAAVKPVASFTYSPSSVKRGVTTTFTSTSTNIPTSYKWTFSDTKTTTTTTSNKITYVFSKTGTYTVSLVASNGAGSSATNSKSIKVS